jgi:hypothetical protein
MVGSVLDHKWRTIFLSTERVAVFPDADLSTWLGVSQIVQTLERRLPFVVPVETRLRWWEAVGPAISYDVCPDDPDFEAVFGRMADIARDLEPRTLLADVHFTTVRSLGADSKVLRDAGSLAVAEI